MEPDADMFPAEVLAVDETLLRHTKTKQIVLGHWISVAREVPRGSAARLRCPTLGERELEVRACSASGHRFAVMGPRALADWVGAGTTTEPCQLMVVSASP